MRVLVTVGAGMLGIMPLRDAIRLDMKKYWKDVSVDNVLVTSSGSEALMVLTQTFWMDYLYCCLSVLRFFRRCFFCA